MNTFLSNMILVTQLNCLEIDSDLSVTSILSDDIYFCKLVGRRNLDGLRALETNLSWLVVINNGNSGLSVLSDQLSIGIGVIKLYVEVLIRLPVVIVLDSNVEGLAVFAIELNDVIEWHVVLVSLGVAVDCGSTNRGNCLLLINDLYCKLS
jgi:hypothetical protein